MADRDAATGRFTGKGGKPGGGRGGARGGGCGGDDDYGGGGSGSRVLGRLREVASVMHGITAGAEQTDRAVAAVTACRR